MLISKADLSILKWDHETFPLCQILQWTVQTSNSFGNADSSTELFESFNT